MVFSRQKYWSGLPLPPPGDLPNPGMEPTSPVSPAWQVDSLPAEPLWSPGLGEKVSWVQTEILFLPCGVTSRGLIDPTYLVYKAK